MSITLSPSGIATAEAFGSPTITTGAVTLSPTGIASTAAVGTPSLGNVIAPAGIASGGLVGSPTLATRATILPRSIPSVGHVGVPRFIASGASRVLASLDETLDYYARLSFPFAQFMLGSYIAPQPVGRPRRATVGWHGADFDDREGSFALARVGGPLEDLVGRVVEVRHNQRSALVYVVASTRMEVQEDLSVSRRVYLALDLLWTSSFSASVTTRTA